MEHRRRYVPDEGVLSGSLDMRAVWMTVRTDIVTLAKVVPGNQLNELRLQVQDLIPSVDQECVREVKPIFVECLWIVMREEPRRDAYRFVQVVILLNETFNYLPCRASQRAAIDS